MRELSKIFEVAEKSRTLFKIKISSQNLLQDLNTILSVSDFSALSQITCTDWIEDEIFALNYILSTSQRDCNLMIEIEITRENPSLPTLLHHFPQAEVMERDLHEMYGIDFIGNETLYDFALEDWQGIPPLRRDFDTLTYVNEHYEFRGGRDDNKNVKDEIKRRKEEAKKAKEEADGGH